MKTTNEKMRQGFESKYPMPSCVTYSARQNRYVPGVMVGNDAFDIAAAYDCRWQTWQAALQESEAGAVGGKYRVEIENCGITHVAYVDDLEFGKAIVDVFVAPPFAQAIEAAAIMKCAEVAEEFEKPGLADEMRALIPQDGRTQLEEFGMKVADAVHKQLYGYGGTGEAFRAIVTNLIGVPPLDSGTVSGEE